MTEIETMQRAKMYLDKLANGVDPISDREMPGDTVLNNVRLSRCFFYVSDVLRQVIENGGVVKRIAVSQDALPPFALSEELRVQIELTDTPAMISHFTERINALIDVTAMRKLKPTAFTAWLTEQGFLTEETVGNKKKKIPTQAGQKIGISSEVREGQRGTYTATLYNQSAQRFLVENLDPVIAISNGEGKQ